MVWLRGKPRRAAGRCRRNKDTIVPKPFAAPSRAPKPSADNQSQGVASRLLYEPLFGGIAFLGQCVATLSRLSDEIVSIYPSGWIQFSQRECVEEGLTSGVSIENEGFGLTAFTRIGPPCQRSELFHLLCDRLLP